MRGVAEQMGMEVERDKVVWPLGHVEHGGCGDIVLEVM